MILNEKMGTTRMHKGEGVIPQLTKIHNLIDELTLVVEKSLDSE